MPFKTLKIELLEEDLTPIVVADLKDVRDSAIRTGPEGHPKQFRRLIRSFDRVLEHYGMPIEKRVFSDDTGRVCDA